MTISKHGLQDTTYKGQTMGAKRTKDPAARRNHVEPGTKRRQSLPILTKETALITLSQKNLTMTAHADAVNLARRLSSRQENDLLQTSLYGTLFALKIRKNRKNRQHDSCQCVDASECLLVVALHWIIRTCF